MIFQKFGYNQNYPVAAAPAGDPDLKVWVDAGNVSSYVSGSTTWYDLTSNANNLTISGSPAFDATTGSLYFANNVNQYALNNAMSNMVISGSDCSIEIWQRYQGPNDDNYYYAFQLGLLVNESPANTGGMLNFYGDNGFNSRALEGRVGGLAAGFALPPIGAGAQVFNKTADLNLWRQIVLTRADSSNDCLMYVNGGLYYTGTGLYGGHIFESFRLNIGGTNALTWPFGAQPWYGDVAIFKAWNGKVLTAAEVLASYNLYQTRFGL